jgi:glycine hydroxymethyltransferase
LLRPTFRYSYSQSKLYSVHSTLQYQDSEVYNLVKSEYYRQKQGIELIASENFVSPAVQEALGSCLTNKYSEGKIGARYYGGNEFIDKMEELCQQRALALFDLSCGEWGVNVQPYSGSPANFAVYTALLQPHDRIMGLDLPSGGHLTHGYQTSKRKVSATSIFFESLPYRVDPATGLIDYDELKKLATLFKPKLIIAGGSAYSRDWCYDRMRDIADSVGAYLMADIAHIAGLVACGFCNDPFQYCDVVTTTTHKSLRGPRAGMIFSRKSLVDKIDRAVFPGLQGGPHNNQIAAVAVALREAKSPEYHQYIAQVLQNAKRLAENLRDMGYTILTGGTDNHLFLWDLEHKHGGGPTGSVFEALCEVTNISVNKNSLPNDTSALNPGGVRIGTPAVTSRGMKQPEMHTIANFLHRIYSIGKSLTVDATEKNCNLKGTDVRMSLSQSPEYSSKIREIAEEVRLFTGEYVLPSVLHPQNHILNEN